MTKLPKFAHLVRRFAGQRADILAANTPYLDVMVTAATRTTLTLEDGTVINIAEVDHISPVRAA